jgi:hypothetical protein
MDAAVDVLGENDTYACQVREALAGYSCLSDVPMLLKCTLKARRWRERRIKTGAVVTFGRFEEFVTTPPLEGLGSDLKMLKRVCEEDKEALDLIDQTLKGEERQGERTDLVNNVNEVQARPEGNSEQYALRKLRKDRPDLHAKVLARELTAHAAMVEGGFRRPTITLPLEPVAAARAIRKHFRGVALRQLIDALESVP